jgi:hypothetical protein
MIKNGMGTSHEDFLSIGEPDLGGGDSKKGDTPTKLDKSQMNIIKGLFDGNTKEAKAQSTIQSVLKDYPDIASKIKQADMSSAYKLKIGEQVFDLKQSADANNFLREINKMISGAVEQSSGSNKILDGLTKTKKEE